MSKKFDLSLDNFKLWIEEQTNHHEKKIIGTEVQSKINLYKLISKIELEEGVEKNVCSDFIENGGKITDIDNKKFLIEVSSGSFYLHRNYVEES